MTVEDSAADPTNVTDGGMAGEHPTRHALPGLVAPSLGSELNTIRHPLTPIACWSLGDVRFEFDSSFVKPEVRTETPLLAALLEKHATAERPSMSIFGHADPVGNDDFNKVLSGRRARAIHALLTRDAAAWEELFTSAVGGDAWGTVAIDVMLAAVGEGVDGGHGAAVRSFQETNGLVVDGIAGPRTREKLFLAYMDTVCIDGSGQPLQLARSEFLGRGADPGGKGDLQGCSEFNPGLLLSRSEIATFTKPKRDAENTPNRRVIAFLFRPGVHVDPAKWPCPRVNEAVDGCKSRFFSDGEKRRQPGNARREYIQNKDTFACRFFDRLANRSPCEGLRNTVLVELVFDDPYLGFCDSILVDHAFADGSRLSLTTSPRGAVIVELARGPFVDATYEREGITQRRRVFLKPPDVSLDEGVWQRLVNLGYASAREPGPLPRDAAELSMALEEFQCNHRIPITGASDGVTRERLHEAHDVDRRAWKDRPFFDFPVVSPGDLNRKSSVT